MNRSHTLAVLAFALIIFKQIPLYSATEVIKFPEEELARESVVPIFDQPEAVKKRNVVTAKKLELGIFGGWTLNDAFFSPLNGGLWTTYHFNEIHGLQLMGSMYVNETSSYAQQLDQEWSLKFQYTPQPQYMVLAAWEVTPFYGKMSITKQMVANLSVYATAGVGTITVGKNNALAFSLGLGQKVYFSKKTGIKADMRALMFSAPNPVSWRDLENATAEPDESVFEQHMVTNLLASLGFFFLF